MRAYERDPAQAEDLLQEMHIALWRSLSGFEAQCSLKTWLFRIANNVGVTHVIKSMRGNGAELVSIEELVDSKASSEDLELSVSRRQQTALLLELVRGLKPLDRQVMLLYLEGLAATEIADVCGFSPINVATKIHRIKELLRLRAGAQGVNNV